MKKIHLWSVAILSAVGCLVSHASLGDKAQPPVAPLLEYLTPEATLRAFVRYLNAGDARAANALITGAKPSAALDEMGKAFKTNSFDILLAGARITTRINGDKAVLRLSSFKMGVGGGAATFAPEVIPLQRVNGRWKFVAGERADVLRLEENPIGNGMKQIIGGVKFSEISFNEGKRAVCQSQLKRWTTAYIRALQDNQNIHSWSSAVLRRSFNVILEKSPALVASDARRESTYYSFNTRLEGVKGSAIKHPDRTILFYEGKAGKFEFRHLIYNVKGATAYTNVGFVDGHIESCSREEVRTLLWKP